MIQPKTLINQVFRNLLTYHRSGHNIIIHTHHLHFRYFFKASCSNGFWTSLFQRLKISAVQIALSAAITWFIPVTLYSTNATAVARLFRNTPILLYDKFSGSIFIFVYKVENFRTQFFSCLYLSCRT